MIEPIDSTRGGTVSGSRRKSTLFSPSRRFARMASGARQTPATTMITFVHFPALLRHALSRCVQRRKRTYTGIHVPRRVYDARRSRAHYERGDRDRAIAEYRYTCVHRPRSSPRTPTTSRSPPLLSVYRDRVTAKPNPRFRIPSSALSGEALSGLRSSFLRLSACLTGRSGPIFVDYLSGPSPRARFKIPRQPKNRVRARQRHKNSAKFREEMIGAEIISKDCRLILM